MALLSLLLLSVLYLVLLISATCYYPDGTIETSSDFMPCVATVGTFSMCCATNRAQFPDQCLPNGLCHNPCATSGLCGDSTGGQYWRESCTDPTWSSPFCLKNVCSNPAQSGGSSNSTAAVSLCVADGTWCCGGDLNSTACCASNVIRVAIAATVGVSSTISTSSSSSTIPSTSSSPSANTPTITGTGPSVSSSAVASSNDNGEKIGVGVGVGVGATCVIVAATVVCMVLWRRKGGKERVDAVESGISPKAELDAEVHEIFEAGSESHQRPSSRNMIYEVHA